MLKIIVKLLISFVLFLVLVIGLGVSGATFYLWPTYLADQKLELSNTTDEEVKQLLHEKKFVASTPDFYFGTPNESVRADAENKVNSVLNEVFATAKKNPSKAAVLFTLKASLNQFDGFDSEERERTLYYFERLLKILKIKGSNELFNVWRYGFPYGWFF